MLLSSTNHLVLSRSCNFSFLIRLTGVLSEIFLSHCAILSIVPEAVCCQFHQVSSHLVKIMFNSFHLQSECCPNYIILIPSLSCFNRSVVVIDLYHSFCISFLLECLHVLLVLGNTFLMPFNLQGSSNVPCSSFLTECSQLCSSPLYSFLEVVQPLQVLWFHSFVKEATLFYLFLFRFSPVPSLDLGTRSLVSGGVL